MLLGWLLGRERAREALLVVVVGNLANLVLDYAFIVQLGWAAWGAGAATALSQYLMLAIGRRASIASGAWRPSPRPSCSIAIGSPSCSDSIATSSFARWR